MLFPVYEVCEFLTSALHTHLLQTKGDLRVAATQFLEWLEHQVLQRENARALALLGTNHQAAGSVKVVLCGHSMGGLVVADTLLALHEKWTDGGPLWPRIISVLAYDTPVSMNHKQHSLNHAN